MPRPAPVIRAVRPSRRPFRLFASIRSCLATAAGRRPAVQMLAAVAELERGAPIWAGPDSLAPLH